MAESILDRVLSSQHAAAIEEFVPIETFNLLVKGLSDKEQDVLRRRFGLSSEEAETLEEIGKKYSVTRERIRQIQNTAVQRIHGAKWFHDAVGSVERLLLSILSAHGGVMEEQLFFQEVLSHAGNSLNQQRALQFLLTEILNRRLEYRLPDTLMRGAWKLKAQSLELAEQAIRVQVDLITKHSEPLLRELVLEKFRATDIAKEHSSWFTDDTILSYLALSSQIGRNPFGEYGLVQWGMIAPKRMNDKIYLVLKKHGKPLHFTEIAKRINEAGFDSRRAYPPTVHNELILNSQYVLVGRGMYALKEWGYKPGVVAEVLVEILKKENRPMRRDELVAAVLKQRIVKRNTVLLALTNKSLFRRIPPGEYELVNKA